MTRVLVFGGRHYGWHDRNAPPEAWQQEQQRVQRERFMLRELLDTVHADRRFTVVIHGGATGADRLAGEWARSRAVEVLAFRVTAEEWKRIGTKAGPIRNQRMLEEGKPDLAIGFPGNRGTADMLRRVREHHIPLIEAVAR